MDRRLGLALSRFRANGLIAGGRLSLCTQRFDIIIDVMGGLIPIPQGGQTVDLRFDVMSKFVGEIRVGYLLTALVF